LNTKGDWREYEFIWLRSLATPLYLAKVNSDRTAVELFSLWPLWLIFWTQPLPPFEVVFETRRASNRPREWRDPTSEEVEEGAGHGDGKRWTIDLGPPFLRLTAQ